MSYGFTEEDIERQRQKVRKTQEGWTYAGKIGETINVSLKRQQGPSAPLRATNGQPATRGKHGSRKTLLDGITFDSAKEAARYQTLKLWVQVGAIRDLRLQVSYDLYGANGERVARYVADMVYWSVELGREVVEDVKSPHTRKLPVYRLKMKLLRAQGISITEV